MGYDPPQSGTTINNLTPGTYCVTITDANGCTISNCTVVNPFGCNISLEISDVNSTCVDDCNGSIDLTVNGGETPYIYGWSDGNADEDRTMLCADNYSVTVTDNNGCSSTISTVIQTFPEMILNTASIDALCFGSCDGAIDLTVEGGLSPFTYDWSDDNLDGIEDPSNLCAGDYSVIVSDNNDCSVMASISIAEPAEMIVFPNVVDASCFEECDGFVNITVSGGTLPYSFSGPIDNLCAGTYTITVTDSNGCTATESFDIEEPDEIVITIDEIGHEMNAQSDGFINVTIEGGTPDFEYKWMLVGSTVSVDEDPTGLAAGSYTLEVTDANGCVVSMEEIIVDNILGVVDHNLKNFINIFPNPTKGLLQIEFDLNEMQFIEIEVYDFTGKKIVEQNERNVFNQRIPIDLTQFGEGVYTVKINIGESFLVKRIVKHD